MRPTYRLLTQATFIPPFSPTGLTSLLSHPAPRPALLAIYHSTLSLLTRLPPTSIYRTSTETLTTQRLKQAQSIQPPNYDTYLTTHLTPTITKLKETTLKGWTENQVLAAISAAQVKAAFQALRELVPNTAEGVDVDGLRYIDEVIKQQEISIAAGSHANTSIPATEAGVGEAAEVKVDRSARQEEAKPSLLAEVELPEIQPEPPLTAQQVNELENLIDAGLIEEVIQQGVAELQLVQEMLKEKPWEPLMEEPVEGQWVYFERPKEPGVKQV